MRTSPPRPQIILTCFSCSWRDKGPGMGSDLLKVAELLNAGSCDGQGGKWSPWEHLLTFWGGRRLSFSLWYPGASLPPLLEGGSGKSGQCLRYNCHEEVACMFSALTVLVVGPRPLLGIQYWEVGQDERTELWSWRGEGLSPEVLAIAARTDRLTSLLTLQTDRTGAKRKEAPVKSRGGGPGAIAWGPGVVCLPTNPKGMTSGSAYWLRMTC